MTLEFSEHFFKYEIINNAKHKGQDCSIPGDYSITPSGSILGKCNDGEGGTQQGITQHCSIWPRTYNGRWINSQDFNADTLALDYFTNRISAAILLLTILFYVFVYTIWLKRRTPQNIVIGGAAGAFPPVIGWTIATNTLSIEPLAFFLIIFFWTPSHFWALSLYKSDDYKKANIPMLPLTNGVESTKTNILVY